MYIRYQSPTPNRRGVHTGIFGLTNALAKAGRLTTVEYAIWRAGNDWYNAMCPNPSDTDPTVYDVALHPLATAWFKDSASHLLARVTAYEEILRSHEIDYVRVPADDPGRVVYEDAAQVVVPHRPDASASYHPGLASTARRTLQPPEGTGSEEPV